MVPSQCSSRVFKICISLRRVSSGNKKPPFPLPLEGPQSTHKVLSPRIPGTDKSPIALKAPTCSRDIRDLNAFGISLRNASGIWENRILTVSLGSSSIQVLWVLGFFSKLYTGLHYLWKAAIFMLNCCHDLYFTTCTYTLKNYLAIKRCFSESSVKFCAKSHYLLACFLVWIVLGSCLWLGSSSATFGVCNRDVTSVRARQASQYLTKPTPQIMWSTEVENNDMKLLEKVAGEPKDRSQAPSVSSALPLPLKNTIFSGVMYERYTRSFAFSLLEQFSW